MDKFDLRENDLPKKDDGLTRVLFMGTGIFASPSLETLITDKNIKVIGVVTKPDAKIGRGKKSDRALHENPIKEASIKQGVRLFQPVSLDEKFVDQIKEMEPTIIVVVSYGKILPKTLLQSAEFGAINVHASLLPKFRGASPIQNALLLGEKETGISIMQMDQGLDTGPVFTQAITTITPEVTTPELTNILAKQGAQTLEKVLPDILTSKIKAIDQDQTKATLCQIIDREDGRISWLTSSQDLLNKYRALYPWPGLFTYWQRDGAQPLRIKINKISAYSGSTDLSALQPGSVFLEEKVVCVRTADSAIVIVNMQRQGKSAQDASTFINGNAEFAKAKLI